LQGQKFLELRQQISAASKAEFLLQPAVGLVDQIELGDLEAPTIAAMLEKYIAPLLDQGADTLVLGCTHYPFVKAGIESVLQAHGRAEVTLIDTGDAVARQLGRLLEGAGLLRPTSLGGAAAATLRGYTTAEVGALAAAFANLLGLHPPVEKVAV